MIVSFRHKGLKLFFEEESLRGIQPEHAKRLRRLLSVLDQVIGPEDLTDPSFRAHLLKGDRQRSWSVWVSGNWRLTFRFLGSNIELVDYEDYHLGENAMMKNPCHPGEVLQDSFGPDGLNITITNAARHLGVSRVTLSRVLNGKAAVSADLALRLERSGLSTARLWLAMQNAYDLSVAVKRKQPKVTRFEIPDFAKAA